VRHSTNQVILNNESKLGIILRAKFILTQIKVSVLEAEIVKLTIRVEKLETKT